MRIYSNCYELMSETGRNLWEMGMEVKPKTYQNKNIEGKDEFITKELICEQYCLTKMPDPEYLFTYTKCKDWADAELEERISYEPNGEPWNPGEAWKLRKDLWEQFLVEKELSFVGNGAHIRKYKEFEYTYCERIMKDTLFNGRTIPRILAIIELLKGDPDTRKAVLNIYGTDYLSEDDDSNHYDGSRRIPCSMYYDFLIRENASGQKQLNICYHQRSSDFVTHFGNDVYLAWKLMEYVAEQVGILPGYLYHTIDSLHAYKKDWGKLKSSLGEQFNRL